eukprot:7010617-Pyramimonas_sp.AAC.1
MAPKVLNLRGKSEIAAHRAHGHRSISSQALAGLNEKRVFILPGAGAFSVTSSPARGGCMMKVGGAWRA